MVVKDEVVDTRFIELAGTLENASAREVIARAVEAFGDRVALCTSFQAEGMVILDIASKLQPRMPVFTVDTGRLPQETYDLTLCATGTAWRSMFTIPTTRSSPSS